MTSIHGHPSLVLQLLDRVINSSEKLEITMFLYRVSFGSRSTETIAGAVSLSIPRTREEMPPLLDAGIVRTMDPYGSGWWFNRNSWWEPTVQALARLYEASRTDVLEMIATRTVAKRRA